MPLLHFFLFGGEVEVDGKGMDGGCTFIHWISRKFTVDLPDSSEEVVSLLTKLFILFSYIL